MGKASRNKQEQELMSKGKRLGRRELKDALITNIRNDIPWIGEKREAELMAYIQKTYHSLTYKE